MAPLYNMYKRKSFSELGKDDLSGFAFDELCPAAAVQPSVQPQPSAPDSTPEEEGWPPRREERVTDPFHCNRAVGSWCACLYLQPR